MPNYFYLFRPKYSSQNMYCSYHYSTSLCLVYGGPEGTLIIITQQTLFCRQFSFKYCGKHCFKLKYCILSKMNTHYFTKIVQHVFTKIPKTLRAHVDAWCEVLLQLSAAVIDIYLSGLLAVILVD